MIYNTDKKLDHLPSFLVSFMSTACVVYFASMCAVLSCPSFSVHS